MKDLEFEDRDVAEAETSGLLPSRKSGIGPERPPFVHASLVIQNSRDYGHRQEDSHCITRINSIHEQGSMQMVHRHGEAFRIDTRAQPQPTEEEASVGGGGQ